MINIKIDSRKVVAGDTFVAIKGANVDGHNFINNAINAGATKIIAEHEVEVPANVTLEVVESSENWLSDYVTSNYRDEVNNVNLIGITGTNGKTTTAYLTYQLLNKLNSKTAYIGTIGFFLPDGSRMELPNTTPNILDLYDLILTAKDKGSINVVMEVSSQGLDMGRTRGLEFSTGLFTNLTQDHLDYHKTMDNYLACKMLLLKQLNNVMIINQDDPVADKWRTYPNIKTYGMSDTDYQIEGFESTLIGTNIKLKSQAKEYTINSNLKGKFNVYNLVGAIAIVNLQGYSLEQIADITNQIYPPKGRCEIIPANNGIAVVDYAHTPDAVEKIINTFKEENKYIITIVGCGGDRDPIKRPIMGKIATELSDYVIFTSDNPRTEDPKKILEAIVAGVNKTNYEVIENREDAINKGLDLLNSEKILLVLGKGHEDYQIIGTVKHHFDDSEVIKEYNKKKID